MPPTKRAKARKKIKVRASIKRQSQKQKIKAVKNKLGDFQTHRLT